MSEAITPLDLTTADPSTDCRRCAPRTMPTRIGQVRGIVVDVAVAIERLWIADSARKAVPLEEAAQDGVIVARP